MSYQSNIAGRYIIDEAEAEKIAPLVPEGMSKGYEARDYSLYPTGTFASAFPLPLIPFSEMPERIKDMTAQKRWPKDHKKRAGFKSLDQNGTNYCWINAPVQCIHYVRAIQGLEHVQLSPASVGAIIKNYRNVGGWGSEGLAFMTHSGVSPVSMWPANAISRQYDTPASRVERKKYIVDEWWELRARNFQELCTCLLLGFPVAIGLNWWGHEVTACELAIRGNDPESDILTDIDNSWGGWGDNGHGLLVRSKATPDDAVVPRVVIT
jgi:hypothetical protein